MPRSPGAACFPRTSARNCAAWPGKARPPRHKGRRDVATGAFWRRHGHSPVLMPIIKTTKNLATSANMASRSHPFIDVIRFPSARRRRPDVGCRVMDRRLASGPSGARTGHVPFTKGSFAKVTSARAATPGCHRQSRPGAASSPCARVQAHGKSVPFVDLLQAFVVALLQGLSFQAVLEDLYRPPVGRRTPHASEDVSQELQQGRGQSFAHRAAPGGNSRPGRQRCARRAFQVTGR